MSPFDIMCDGVCVMGSLAMRKPFTLHWLYLVNSLWWLKRVQSLKDQGKLKKRKKKVKRTTQSKGIHEVPLRNCCQAVFH